MAALTEGIPLPDASKKEHILSYDAMQYDFRSIIAEVLQCEVLTNKSSPLSDQWLLLIRT